MSRTNRSAFCKAPTTPKSLSLPTFDSTTKHPNILPNVRKRKKILPATPHTFYRQIRLRTSMNSSSLPNTHTTQKKKCSKTRAHLQKRTMAYPGKKERKKTLPYTARQSHIVTAERDYHRTPLFSVKSPVWLYTHTKQECRQQPCPPPSPAPSPALPRGSSHSSGQDILYPAPCFN